MKAKVPDQTIREYVRETPSLARMGGPTDFQASASVGLADLMITGRKARGKRSVITVDASAPALRAEV
jgi:hypothetical protein